MAVGTTNFPASLDTLDTLIRTANLVPTTTTTDSGGVGANSTNGTTIAVASTTSYPASGTISIDSEIITYSGTTSTTFTGCVRGSDGTTGAVHANGASVNSFLTAVHHMVLANAVVAAETKIGSGSATPANQQVLAGNGTGTSTWTGTPTVSTLTTTTANSGGLTQEAWTGFTYLNSWSDFSAGNPAGSYMKDTLGFVNVRGIIKGGANAANCATLPAGYRPATSPVFATMANAGSNELGYVQIATAGGITPEYAGTLSFFCLDGTRFATN